MHTICVEFSVDSSGVAPWTRTDVQSLPRLQATLHTGVNHTLAKPVATTTQ